MPRLAAEKTAATLPIGAAATLLLLVLVGSVIDISRGYMAQTSLQSACDSGVLAGRRALSKSDVYEDAERARANRMFAFNFPESIGATGVAFTTAATDEGEVTGTASADLPTVVMALFGFQRIELAVACSAELQLASADVMFVLDTTGSMNCNVGVSCSSSSEASDAKIRALRDAVRDFYRTVAGAVQNKDETRIRFAFVPYSMTVNARDLILNGALPTDYIADSVEYQSRRAQFRTTPRYIGSAGSSNTVVETFPSAIRNSQCDDYADNDYPSNGSNPVDSGTAPANTTRVTYSYNGWTRTSGSGSSARGTCRRNRLTVVTTYAAVYDAVGNWRYIRTTLDTSALKGFATVQLVTGASSNAYAPSPGYIGIQPLAQMSGTSGLTKSSYTWNGCLEERATVQDADMDPVPADAADLDINSAPDSEATKWRPYFGPAEFTRGSNYTSLDSSSNLASATEFCPSPMRQFDEIDTSDPLTVPGWLDTYLSNLRATGGTYHDLGMIWGGRLGSPNGIFGDNVNDEPERAVSRHIIFMTDDQMAPEIDFYSAYGLERYDNRVAPQGTSRTGLVSYHNSRFVAACRAARAEGYTVWVVAFGTSVSDEMRDCASASRAYLSTNTTELKATFRFIATQVADLRLNQ